MDEEVRQAERAVRADPSQENLRRLRLAVTRATGTPPRPAFTVRNDDDWLCEESEAVATLGDVLADRDEVGFRLWCLSYGTGYGRAFAVLVSRRPWPASGDDELDEQDYDPWGGNPDAVPVARLNALETMISQGAYAWTIKGLRVACSEASFDGLAPNVAELLNEVENDLGADA